MRIEGAGTGVGQLRIGVEGGADIICIIGAAIGETKVAISVAEGDVVIDVDAAAMGIPGTDGVMAVLVEDVVLDVDAAEGLPKDDTVAAVVGHDVVVNFQIGNSSVTGDLNAVCGIGEEDVIEDNFVFTAKV